MSVKNVLLEMSVALLGGAQPPRGNGGGGHVHKRSCTCLLFLWKPALFFFLFPSKYLVKMLKYFL